MIMKAKVSKYTPFFVIGLVMVTIARCFYDPLQLGDAWMILKEEEIPIPVMKGICFLFVPTLLSAYDALAYSLEIMKEMSNIESGLNNIFSIELMYLGYFVITYCLEKFHAYWHEEEGAFSTCVDMLCVENIVMYMFDLMCYGTKCLIQGIELPKIIYGIGAILLALPIVWGVFFLMTYMFANMIVGFGIPMIVALWGPKLIGDAAASIIAFILLMVCMNILVR